MDGNDGKLVYTTLDTINTSKDLLRPWFALEGNRVGSSSASVEDLAAAWLKKFGNNDNSSESEDRKVSE